MANSSLVRLFSYPYVISSRLEAIDAVVIRAKLGGGYTVKVYLCELEWHKPMRIPDVPRAHVGPMIVELTKHVRNLDEDGCP